MKFTDAVLGLFLTGILVNGLFTCVRMCSREEKEVNKLRQKTVMEKFIGESFKNTCRGKGFESLNEWQVNCRALFGLEYIGWSDAGEFMDVSMNKTNQDLFYGTWKKGEETGEVYCRRREKLYEK